MKRYLKIIFLTVLAMLSIIVLGILVVRENKIINIQEKMQNKDKNYTEISENFENKITNEKEVESIETLETQENETKIEEQDIQQNNVTVMLHNEEEKKIEENKQEEKKQESVIEKTTTTATVKKSENTSNQKNNTTKQNTENINKQITTNVVQDTQEIEIKTQTTTTPQCTSTKHGMATGNSNKWFNTKEEAIALYNAEIKKWGDLWTSFQIENEEYYKNCPYGYEIWSCPYCEKWTINFYYD